ncbi:hypothetical protein [Uliginosibacterium sp. 31-12]|uniref:hypothetical protein n=1 Tax=Uliginosibacterium sp. 31-12 TaxID=3062781 RepID=UPI0026E2D097|nr:hypothetical protein [Uliginosibacterium sp. 31-12]MDO6387907.1 hypothetical protein [Uliginosibacterium sp. 31-12]
METLNAFLRGAPARSERPLYDLLRQLPLLSAAPGAAVDYEAADAALLVSIADNAETAMCVIHRGLQAIGVLLANSSPEYETKELSAATVEAIGWLIAELADVSATAHLYSAACRRHTFDFDPPEPRVTPPAIP